MSLRGVRQCQKLLIRYSDRDGSSRGIRDWMRENLVDFAKSNPALKVETQLKRATHPFVRAYYANGNDKTIGLKNLDAEDIDDYIFDLRSQIGRKISSGGYAKPVLSQCRSVQGEWNEEVTMYDREIEIEHVYATEAANEAK
jgi:large subunit ribosomal protein L43